MIQRGCLILEVGTTSINKYKKNNKSLLIIAWYFLSLLHKTDYVL